MPNKYKNKTDFFLTKNKSEAIRTNKENINRDLWTPNGKRLNLSGKYTPSIKKRKFLTILTPIKLFMYPLSGGGIIDLNEKQRATINSKIAKAA